MLSFRQIESGLSHTTEEDCLLELVTWSDVLQSRGHRQHLEIYFMSPRRG